MKPTSNSIGRRAALACALAAIGAGSACSLSFDAGDLACEGPACTQRASRDAASCGDGPCGEAGVATACLGRVRSRAVSGGEVPQSIALQTLATLAPVAGVAVRSCLLSDLYCEEPLGAATTGADGTAQIAVPSAAWGGYFEYEAPNSMTSIVHFLPEYEAGEGGALVRVGLGERHYEGAVTSFDTLARVGSASGAPFALDPSLGFVFGRVVGCDGQGLPGAVVTLDAVAPTTLVVYAADGLPSTSLTSTGPGGDFFVGNVPADRFVILRARLAEGRVVGERRAVSRAGAMTVVAISPSESLE
ncbi:MAG TPA: hypothetical protein VFS43_24965 [Polyangiaceae bacterium]|nr:hypothetical protein [Polyangiaceae bacterium]